MEIIKDDFHRTRDGQIDYTYYKALAAELRREERRRLTKAAVLQAVRFWRRKAAVSFRLLSPAGRLGSAHR
jgi:hypothetical protein